MLSEFLAVAKNAAVGSRPVKESPSGLDGPEYETTSCQCAGDKDDKEK